MEQILQLQQQAASASNVAGAAAASNIQGDEQSRLS